MSSRSSRFSRLWGTRCGRSHDPNGPPRAARVVFILTGTTQRRLGTGPMVYRRIDLPGSQRMGVSAFITLSRPASALRIFIGHVPLPEYLPEPIGARAPAHPSLSQARFLAHFS